MAGVDRRGAESEESDEGAGIEVSEVRNSMRLFAQSTKGLQWRNQRNPMTAEISRSNGVTRKLTGKTLVGARWTGTVTYTKYALEHTNHRRGGDAWVVGGEWLGDGDRKLK